ncbi:hypothetical protein FGO68_gene904 [Halteria grandinella]|uniref:Uncharacterized protein n=1 Tax=Halteria grandinella TaxID=5974 RepID=A0A8J8ND41_HALGN|nr:hypothetical protein FGO68_gene904 [Halteria grandinella]
MIMNKAKMQTQAIAGIGGGVSPKRSSLLNNSSDDNFFSGEQSSKRLSRKLNQLSVRNPDQFNNDGASMLEDGNNEDQLLQEKLPQENFEQMIARHREALDDIFDSYNQFLMKESPSKLSYIPFSHSNTKKNSPRPNESSLDKLLRNDPTQRTLPGMNGNVTQTSMPTNGNLYLGGPSGTIEFDVNQYGGVFEEIKHPDFFGAIIAQDPERADVAHVATEEQYLQVQQLFDQYYNYILPKLDNKKANVRSYKKMTLRDFEQLADKSNILKFDIDSKLSKHLNRMLVNRKDDPFFQHRYQVYMRKKLGKAVEHVQKTSDEESIHRNKYRSGSPAGEKIINDKIAALKHELQEIAQHALSQIGSKGLLLASVRSRGLLSKQNLESKSPRNEDDSNHDTEGAKRKINFKFTATQLLAMEAKKM